MVCWCTCAGRICFTTCSAAGIELLLARKQCRRLLLPRASLPNVAAHNNNNAVLSIIGSSPVPAPSLEGIAIARLYNATGGSAALAGFIACDAYLSATVVCWADCICTATELLCLCQVLIEHGLQRATHAAGTCRLLHEQQQLGQSD